MFDNKAFGEKLKNHRKAIGLTQEEVAEKIGVSPQAISKWENGDCLRDCYNLKQLGEAYGISLDILLDMNSIQSIDDVSRRIEQLATEFVWAEFAEYASKEKYAHIELGDDLWEMWKAIYFVETGDKELQKQDKERGRTRIAGPYGLKIWDDDGIACVIKQSFADGFPQIPDSFIEEIKWLLTPEILSVVKVVKCFELTSKEELARKSGLQSDALNAALLALIEKEYVEFFRSNERNTGGYKLNAKKGIVVWLLLSAAALLKNNGFTLSQYLPR